MELLYGVNFKSFGTEYSRLMASLGFQSGTQHAQKVPRIEQITLLDIIDESPSYSTFSFQYWEFLTKYASRYVIMLFFIV